MSFFDDILGGSGIGAKTTPDLTSERIADAVELLAAITGYHFFSETSPSKAAEDRFAAIIKAKAAQFCRRQGA